MKQREALALLDKYEAATRAVYAAEQNGLTGEKRREVTMTYTALRGQLVEALCPAPPVVRLRPWERTCGDGCCDDYGVDVIVNGEKLFVKDEHNMLALNYDGHEATLGQILQAIAPEVDFAVEEEDDTE